MPAFHPRPPASSGRRLRGRLETGTILGAGLLAGVALTSGAAQAQDVVKNFIMPQGATVESSSNGSVKITTSVTGTITAAGGQGGALLVNTVDGPQWLTFGAAVRGVDFGVRAEATGRGLIELLSTKEISATADDSYGIFAKSDGGNIRIGADSFVWYDDTPKLGGPVSGDHAIFASTSGIGAIFIGTRAGGTITGRSSGIVAQAYDGQVNITLGAALTSTSGNGVHVAMGNKPEDAGSGTVTIRNSASITAASSGILANVGKGSRQVTMEAAVTGAAGAIIGAQGAGGVDVSALNSVVTGTTSVGISTTADQGMTSIVVDGANARVRGRTDAISATSSTGDIKIDLRNGGSVASEYETTTGVASTLTAGTGRGIYASSRDGLIDIGGSFGGLSGSVAGTKGIEAITTGTGRINVRTAAGGMVSGASGQFEGAVDARSKTGDISLDLGGTVTNTRAGSGVFARADGSGAISLTGAGNIIGGNSDHAIFAQSWSGAITIGGTGTTVGNGSGMPAIGAFIVSDTVSSNPADRATADLLINRSGAITGQRGVEASNLGSGKVTIQGLGAVTASNGSGITTRATSGATLIDLTRNVSSTSVAGTNNDATAVFARASDAGDITVKSAAGVAIAANGGTSQSARAIVASSQGGNIDIGGATGLGGAISVTGRRIQDGAILASTAGAGNINIKTSGGASVTATATGSGISSGVAASTSGSGAVTIDLGADVSVRATINGVTGVGGEGVRAQASGGTISITTAAGVAVTAGTAISTSNQATGATNIAIGVGSTITGSVAIQSGNDRGSVTVNNSGTVNGSIFADTSKGGTATFNNAGTLVLTGSQANYGQRGGAGFTVFNRSGGVLTGTGSFGDVVAQAGSFIRPGDRSLAPVNGVPQMGTLSTNTLTLSSGATVEIRADASGVSDKVAVTSEASLGGATLKLLATPTDAPSWTTGKTYTVLTAGSVSGTFVLATDLAFLKPTAVYSASDVRVTLVRNEVTFDSIGVTSTQKGVGAALQSQQDTQSVQGTAVIQSITGLTVPQAQAALETLSGSGSTGAQTAMGTQVASFTRAVTVQGQSSPLASGAPPSAPSAFSGSDMPLAYGDLLDAAAAGGAFKGVKGIAPAAAPVAPRQTWRIWASFFGNSYRTDANVSTGTPGVTGHDWGGATGFEAAVLPNLIAGVALGGSTSPFSVGNRSTFGDSAGALGSVYGTATFDQAYVSASLGYGRFETSSTRVIAIPGAATERQNVKYGTNAYTGFVEVGYNLPVMAYTVTPFASVQPTVMRQEAATETSDTPGALFGLSYRARDTVSLPASLGLQVERSFTVGGWDAVVQTRAAWVHEFQPDRGLRASFVSLPGASFSSTGMTATEDLARLSSTLTLSRDSGLSLFARAGADLSDTHRSYSGQGGIKFAW